MIINCVWEHNGNDTLLYATNFVGAYTRGESLEIAKTKMPDLNAANLESATEMIKGTARSMGVDIIK